mgnify:FL=1
MNWNTIIKDFKIYLTIERGLAKNTVESYGRDLEKLRRYLIRNNCDSSPIHISSEEIK